jgi:predicted RNA methylase
MGHYPLALEEARRIRRFLALPDTTFPAIDPCAGCGTAFVEITAGANAVRYGVELDAYRAEAARKVLDHVIQGSCFDVHCPVESFSLAFQNPPYDWTGDERHSERAEAAFLDHCFRWLRVGGVLVLVIPGSRVAACADILAVQFRDKAIYRLSEPDAVRYGQVVVFGVRRSPRERSQLKDREVAEARRRLQEMARRPESLAVLPDEPDRTYLVPAGEPVSWAYRGIPLDAVEDLLPTSGAYRRATRILFAPPNRVQVCPLTPLHSGHAAILTVSGMLDGILGSGADRHVAAWSSVKITDRLEEVAGDGTVTIRERERFAQMLSLVYKDGRTAILTDGSKQS